MRQRITYSVDKDGQLVRSFSKPPSGNRLLDEALRPFDEQMRRSHYDLECAGNYRNVDMSSRQVKEAWNG